MLLPIHPGGEHRVACTASNEIWHRLLLCFSRSMCSSSAPAWVWLLSSAASPNLTNVLHTSIDVVGTFVRKWVADGLKDTPVSHQLQGGISGLAMHHPCLSQGQEVGAGRSKKAPEFTWRVEKIRQVQPKSEAGQKWWNWTINMPHTFVPVGKLWWPWPSHVLSSLPLLPPMQKVSRLQLVAGEQSSKFGASTQIITFKLS